MSSRAHDSNAVLEANRRFYDQIAPHYEKVDSRRGEKNDRHFLNRVLKELSEVAAARQEKRANELSFLDAGAGSGFLSQYAQNFFSDMVLLDISQAMLDRIPLTGVRKVCGDCNHLPFAAASFDVVGAFATLHHLYDPVEFFAEAYRVLRPRGLLYCDHDIERAFIRRFRPALRAYRYFFDHGHAYLKACPQAKESDYFVSEFHGQEGLDGLSLEAAIRACGFRNVTCSYHWEGMGLPSAALRAVGLARPFSRRGWAPLLRIVAEK